MGSAKKLWSRVGTDFDQSFAAIRQQLINVVQVGRAATAASSLAYTPAVLEETDQDAPPVGVVNTDRFLMVAPDGRTVGGLLDEAPVHAKILVGQGSSAQDALARTSTWLTGTLLTVMADTGRGVVAADIAQRPLIQGYVRMLNPPSCNRCVILAGKWFRWNTGFQRHPRCDCRHIPAAENRADDFTTDPYRYFHSLTTEQQEKTFGRIDARAIRDGADIYRTVNVGQRGLATATGARRFGTPSRMTLDDIYRVAGTRSNAIALMEREGFITGPQVAGGNVLGNAREGFGQLGKGGKARAAFDAVVQARRTDVRDPLNRYTMTAAERRLFDAKTRLDVGHTGVWPQSIGSNSADRYTKPRPITATQLQLLEQQYRDEVRKLPTAPDSVRRLAALLGIH